MSGTSIQYYIEVKDAAGTVVTRVGQVDEPEPRQRSRRPRRAVLSRLHRRRRRRRLHRGDAHDDEDPLDVKKPIAQVDTSPVITPHTDRPAGRPASPTSARRSSRTRSGARPSARSRSSASASLFYVLAGNAGRRARRRRRRRSTCGTPPCRTFDTTYDADVAGRRQARPDAVRTSRIGLGVVDAVVAGYFWYRSSRRRSSGDMKVSGTNSTPAGDDVGSSRRRSATTTIGAAAAVRGSDACVAASLHSSPSVPARRTPRASARRRSCAATRSHSVPTATPACRRQHRQDGVPARAAARPTTAAARHVHRRQTRARAERRRSRSAYADLGRRPGSMHLILRRPRDLPGRRQGHATRSTSRPSRTTSTSC